MNTDRTYMVIHKTILKRNQKAKASNKINKLNKKQKQNNYTIIINQFMNTSLNKKMQQAYNKKNKEKTRQ